MSSVYVSSLQFIKINKDFCNDKFIISITYPLPNTMFPSGQKDVVFNNDNVLRLKFSDDDLIDAELFDPDHIEFRAFNASMADEVIKFVRRAIEQNKDILVHCYAGMIRSASIGIFIAEMFGYELRTESSNLQPLQYVLDILHEQHMADFIKV